MLPVNLNSWEQRNFHFHLPPQELALYPAYSVQPLPWYNKRGNEIDPWDKSSLTDLQSVIPLAGLLSPPWTLVCDRGSWKSNQIQHRFPRRYWFEGVFENPCWLSAYLNASHQQCHPLIIKHNMSKLLWAVQQHPTLCYFYYEIKISCVCNSMLVPIARLW